MIAELQAVRKMLRGASESGSDTAISKAAGEIVALATARRSGSPSC
jgi:hypothetical protein